MGTCKGRILLFQEPDDMWGGKEGVGGRMGDPVEQKLG